MPQGALENLLVFVMVKDEFLAGRAWTCHNVTLSCFGYADDTLLFSNNKASLERMVADCCGAFGQAGFEVGLDQTHWSSSIDGEEEVPHVLGQDTQWERSLASAR